MISENVAHFYHLDEEVEQMMVNFERKKLKEFHIVIAEDDGIPDITKKLAQIRMDMKELMVMDNGFFSKNIKVSIAAGLRNLLKNNNSS